MNVKRFTARTSREALALVKQDFGADAVVMSTRPCPEGVEVVAMAGDSVMELERVGAAAPARSRSAHASAPLQPALAPTSWTAQQRPAAARLAETPRQAPQGHQPRPQWAGVQGRQRLEPSLDPEPWPAPAQAASASAVSAVAASVQRDVKALEMSTLSFQDYVRQRMNKRREAELAADTSAQVARQPAVVSPIEAARKRLLASSRQALVIDESRLPVLHDELTLADLAEGAGDESETGTAAMAAPAIATPAFATPAFATSAGAAVAARRRAASSTQPAGPSALSPPSAAPLRREQTEMMSELRSMRGLIEQRFGALAFMEKLQRQPRQALLAQRLLDAGFSPGLIRRLVDGLPADVDEQAWAATVLQRNLQTADREAALEEQGGIYALIGTTGVGKTTSTAKLAAAFAAKHGAANLGLVTLDAYRVGAHEQLRTYGRILGVPVHTAHDRASLEDLLELLAGKRMVLIDTAGMAQRDSRTRELLEMVSHSAIKRLLVINASAQGETIEDQLAAYAAQSCSGVVLSKLDEAVKLGPALDSMVRHKLKVVAVANGQRVPEDWHRLSANALVQRALRGGGSPAWKLSDNEVNLIFAGMPLAAPVLPTLSAHA